MLSIFFMTLQLKYCLAKKNDYDCTE